ncbi:MAG: homogentisate 1,2-dioxygenase [Vulcanimicrobiaceae bacterium]
MAFYVRAGSVPPKRHTQFRRPDGRLHAEELLSTTGFAGAYSLLYHLDAPTAAREVRPWLREAIAYRPNEPLQNRHFRTQPAAATDTGDAIDARRPLLGNADVTVAVADVDRPMPYFYRNGGGDEFFFVPTGSGVLETQFGVLAYRAYDYAYVPAGTTYRLVPNEPTRLVVYVSRGHIAIPQRFRNDAGQLAEHAPYCERDFRTPVLGDPIATHGDYEVRVTHGGRNAAYVVEHHPCDVVGWDGCCYPYAFNLDEYAPVTGKLHQPPTAHAVFEAPGAAFCAFVPRMLDYHPLAVAVPYNHANVDCDEVLYYVDGQFISRRGIAEGSVTLHAAGIPHGPQPGVVEASLGKASTDELAIMVDTFAPLEIAEAARACEDAWYARSWSAAAPQPLRPA